MLPTIMAAGDQSSSGRTGDDDPDRTDRRYALTGPSGVKVIDTVHDLVLCSAPGRKGLEQAEALLALASRDEDRP